MVSPVQSQLLWTNNPPWISSAASASPPSSAIVQRVERANASVVEASVAGAAGAVRPGVLTRDEGMLRGSAKLIDLSMPDARTCQWCGSRMCGRPGKVAGLYQSARRAGHRPDLGLFAFRQLCQSAVAAGALQWRCLGDPRGCTPPPRRATLGYD